MAPERPSGHRWEVFRRLVFATYGPVCVVCGHGGAQTVDHLVSRAERPDLSWSLANCRPIHAAPYNRCPVCKGADGKGMNCNGVKGGYSLERARRIVAERTAGSRPSPPKPEKPRDTGREF